MKNIVCIALTVLLSGCVTLQPKPQTKSGPVTLYKFIFSSYKHIYVEFDGSIPVKNQAFCFENNKMQCPPLLEDILLINGVRDVAGLDRSLIITKNGKGEWESIIPPLREILERHFRGIREAPPEKEF